MKTVFLGSELNQDFIYIGLLPEGEKQNLYVLHCSFD